MITWVGKTGRSDFLFYFQPDNAMFNLSEIWDGYQLKAASGFELKKHCQEFLHILNNNQNNWV